MPSIIVIEASNQAFRVEATRLLTERGFKELSSGTFVGEAAAQPVIDELRNLDSYVGTGGPRGVKLHFGIVSRV